MKMLTGLLPASEGGRYLSQPVDPGNIDTHRRVGYICRRLFAL